MRPPRTASPSVVLGRRRARHRVRVVTDSTASLPPELRAGAIVVPLTVVVDGTSGREGEDIDADEIAAALASGARVSTSQPPRAAFEAAYAQAAAGGATGVVSVHLSGELSGTVHQAAAAAATAALPVRVVDSRTSGLALGFAVRQGALAAAEGAAGDDVARRAVRVAASSRAIFMVDSLDHLRRGGRISAPAAALGTVLGVRPLLRVRDGRIEVVQRVRTRAAAVDRLVGVAVESAGRRVSPLLAVHHVGPPELAFETARELEEQTGCQVVVSPLSAVLAAHVGPGTLAIVVAEGA
ncbi:DegV family protein [Luteimicrobium subarcticum]|uniref:DegV family protein with EDD domain n=1 Tax=Luteimicrobium subarcticum TaxID=620910 RepID=A0A2M8WQX6_9MICO|nr:DegV family protein [Luteimicrobium subarcticum]PJI93340.1 DegV family protein with EDD domain [Luteimicrobium subarcticum]